MTNTIEYLCVESASVRREIADTSEAVYQRGAALEAVGRAAQNSMTDFFGTADAEELAQRSTWVRGAALHALTLGLELAVLAGTLEGIALMRRAAASDEPDDELR